MEEEERGRGIYMAVFGGWIFDGEFVWKVFWYCTCMGGSSRWFRVLKLHGGFGAGFALGDLFGRFG